jgi:hypothetical protein
MPSKYFQNYGKSAIEINLISDLYDEAIFMQGFSGYYVPNTNSQYRDLIYGDDPLKHFDDAYKLDIYLVNTMDYGDEQDFFSKFGLQVKNQIKIQFTVKEFKKQTKKSFDQPLEGDLIFIPFMKDSGELYEIKFVNTSKDLYTLGRNVPYYYELSLEPFKYNDESLDTGITAIDNIEIEDSFKTSLILNSGSGNYSIGEIIYQGTDANNYTAQATVTDWDTANNILTVMNTQGEFTNSTIPLIGSSSNAAYTLISFDFRDLSPEFDNIPIKNESTNYINTSELNPFGSLSYD